MIDYPKLQRQVDQHSYPLVFATISGAGMDRRIERPGRKRRKLIVRVAIGVAVLAGALLLWWLMPGGNSLAVDAQAIRTGTVTRERAPSEPSSSSMRPLSGGIRRSAWRTTS